MRRMEPVEGGGTDASANDYGHDVEGRVGGVMCERRSVPRGVRAHRARVAAQPRQDVPAHSHVPRTSSLPRRHDHPGKHAGIGCRHTHGLDIVWSARHGVSSIGGAARAESGFPAVAEPIAPSFEVDSEVEKVLRAAENLTRESASANALAGWDPRHAERGARVRLAALYTVLALGFALSLLGGAAVAVALRVHLGVWGAGLGVGAAMWAVMAWRAQYGRTAPRVTDTATTRAIRAAWCASPGTSIAK